MLTLHEIDFAHKLRPFNDDFNSTPFTFTWWNPLRACESDQYFEVRDNHEPVARICINHKKFHDSYIDPKDTLEQDNLCEIVFFEVAAHARGQGIGTQSLEHLASAFPNTRFYAFSENADAFWERQGWMHHLNSDPSRRPPHYRPLYVQPHHR